MRDQGPAAPTPRQSTSIGGRRFARAGPHPTLSLSASPGERSSGPPRDHHGQALVALHEHRMGANRFAGQADLREALQDLFPDDAQLQLGQAIADAAMDAEAEREMVAR